MDVLASDIRVSLPNGRKLFFIPELKINSGSHVLIQGESGCGKTTLLHLLAGLFTPERGEVRLGKNLLSQLSDQQRCALRLKNVGVIFQKLNLLDHLTVSENILLGLSKAAGQNATDERIQKALSKVNLEGRELDRVSFLSLGEQQRVATARVLAQSPELILADEPTSSLDQTNAQFVLKALKSAAREKTLIVVSHDHRIANYFDRVISFAEYCR